MGMKKEYNHRLAISNNTTPAFELRTINVMMQTRGSSMKLFSLGGCSKTIATKPPDRRDINSTAGYVNTRVLPTERN